MSQIQKKFIADNAIDGTKVRLLNNETFRARNNAGSGDVDFFKLTTADVLEFLKQPRAGTGVPLPSASCLYAIIQLYNAVLEIPTSLDNSGIVGPPGCNNFATIFPFSSVEYNFAIQCLHTPS